MINIFFRCAYAWGIAILAYSFVDKPQTYSILISIVGGILIGIGSAGWTDPE